MSRDAALAPGEQLILSVHPHWKVLVWPVVLGILIVAAAVAAWLQVPFGTASSIAGLILAVVALALLARVVGVPLLRWRTTQYSLTSKRLRVRKGILTREGKDIPLARVTDVSFETGLLDRIVGAGTLVVESPGEHGQLRLAQIPHVQFLQGRVFELVEEERQRILLKEDPDA